MLPPGVKITTDVLWLGTLFLVVIDAVFIPILAWRINPATFGRLKWTLGITTAILFSAIWTWGFVNFWDSVYRYVFPSWAHWVIPPIFGLLYAGISLLIWWRAVRLHGNAVVNFCLLGGLWGMITHLFAVSVGIVRKPPALQGAAPVAVVVIATFEFMFYWCVILTLAVFLYHAWRKMRHQSVQEKAA